MSSSRSTQYISVAMAVIFLSPAVQAQDRVLEEIIVTAQRREQSIQEVPISLEAYSGTVLHQQGFRSLVDLSNFSPSTEIDVRTQDQSVSIRGLGTSSTNPGMEMAVPIFSDGVHYGRTPMITGAFLDLERVEVLRGPQPVAFGMNATAGGFSMTSRTPGTEWQANLNAEYGNFGRTSVEGGIGGPITETFGLRVAGKWDQMEGFVRDIVSNEMFPNSEETGARIILQWAPTESFEATLKAEYMNRDKEGDGNVMCRTRHPVVLNERAVVIPGLTSFDDVFTLSPIPDDCEDGFRRIGLREGNENTFKPVPDIRQEDTRTGFIDMSTLKFMTEDLTALTSAADNHKAYSYRLGMNYELANGIIINANTGYVDYVRTSFFDNSSSPILSNYLTKGEVFDMWSQEVRILSPRGGMFEWEGGVFYQIEDLDGSDPNNPELVAVTIRGNIRQPIRYTYNWQDSEWMSAFGALTFNFLDNKASIDVGGRYTEVNKAAHTEGFSKTFIFDINPIDPGTGRANSTNLDGTIRNVASSMINCATGHPYCGSYGAGFWTHQWRTNDVPDAWHTQAPVGVSPLFNGTQDNSRVWEADDYKESNFDPQVSLRYRPSDDLSLYARWARATKSGGFDISAGTLPSSDESFRLLPETAETFEVGAKGNLMDSSALYNITLFTIDISDLQIETNVPTAIGGGRDLTNAGKQRTRGIEFDIVWAATDRLTLDLSGALMDGKMVSYQGAGCTDFEFETADSGPCLSAAESVDLYGTDDFEGTIDRTGFKGPRTPDWKFVGGLEYWYPMFDRHKLTFSTKTTYSDGWIANAQDFDESIKFPTRLIVNLNLGFGDQNDTWELNFWVRNLLSEGLRYYPEFDPERPASATNPFSGSSGQMGIIDQDPSPRDYKTYGVQFTYNYN